jgi:hypothetical protein
LLLIAYGASLREIAEGRGGGDAGGQGRRFVFLASDGWFFYARVLKFFQDGEIIVFFYLFLFSQNCFVRPFLFLSKRSFNDCCWFFFFFDRTFFDSWFFHVNVIFFFFYYQQGAGISSTFFSSSF